MFNYNSSEEIKYDCRFFSFLSQTRPSYPLKSLFLVCDTLFAQTATLCDFHLGKALPSQDTDSKGGNALPALREAGGRKAFSMCTSVSQASPYFNSPALAGKQRLEQPQPRPHTHTHKHGDN